MVRGCSVSRKKKDGSLKTRNELCDNLLMLSGGVIEPEVMEEQVDDDLNKMTIINLKKMAKNMNMSNYSALRKAALIKAIIDYQQQIVEKQPLDIDEKIVDEEIDIIDKVNDRAEFLKRKISELKELLKKEGLKKGIHSTGIKKDKFIDEYMLRPALFI